MLNFIKSIFKKPEPQVVEAPLPLFQDLGLDERILRGITEMGFTHPTAIQNESIPHVLAGKDVIANSQTGTGKTAAFMLPIIHRLLQNPKPKKSLRALILAPTRELALQSSDHVKDLSRFVPIRAEAVFGGVSIHPQIEAFSHGAEIISATPGRLLDHIYEGRVDFGELEVLVLDEADRMLDMGFLPDVERIISFLPPKRQNLIFSATLPEEVMKLIHEICTDPVRVEVKTTTITPDAIDQKLYPVAFHQKTDLLIKLMTGKVKMNSTIVFTSTKIGADRLWKSLERSHIKTALIHGDRDQKERQRALDFFKRGQCQVLVATDVAARGIDVKDVSHVINFDVPQSPEDYIHRIGRTARAKAKGEALTLVCPDEEERIDAIEKKLQRKLPRLTLPDFVYQKSEPRTFGQHRPGQGRPQHGGHSGPHRGPRPGGSNRGPRRFSSQRPRPQGQGTGTGGSTGVGRGPSSPGPSHGHSNAGPGPTSRPNRDGQHRRNNNSPDRPRPMRQPKRYMPDGEL